MKPFEITTVVRVDLPHAGGGFRYFFVRAEYEHDWHPWWGNLYRFLLTLERTPSGVTSDGDRVEVAFICDKRRQEFTDLLTRAPSAEVEGHRTLRFALKALAEHDLDIPVRFFSSTTSQG